MRLTIRIFNKFSINKYKAPKWLTENLKETHIPKYRLDLGVKQTQVEQIDLKSLEINKSFKVYIKRDDLNHDLGFVCGNKLRKFEFLLADALKSNCKHVITAGGLQSNHCRTAAVLANMLKLKSHLFLRSHTDQIHELANNGNLLLSRLYGSSIYLIERKSKYLSDIKLKMELLEEKIYNFSKEKSYQIPIGGSNSIGLFGYLNTFNEMLTLQYIDEYIDDIVVTTGSGGTMSSLAIGNLLTGSKFKIHAFSVCDNADYFYSHLNDQLKALNMSKYKANDLINIIDDYKGIGYGLSTNTELEALTRLLRSTNILFDPVYTFKAFNGLLNVMNSDNAESIFKGKRILFVHTGGVFSMFDGRFNRVFDQNENINSPIYNCFYDNINNINF